MKLKLSTGREVFVDVHHLEDTSVPDDAAHDVKVPSAQKRVKLPGTKVRLTVGDREIVSQVVCKPPDKFRRLEGRERAVKHLLFMLKPHTLRNNKLKKLSPEEMQKLKQEREKIINLELTRDERGEIFRSVYSEYFTEVPRFKFPKLGGDRKVWGQSAVDAIRKCLNHEQVLPMVVGDEKVAGDVRLQIIDAISKMPKDDERLKAILGITEKK